MAMSVLNRLAMRSNTTEMADPHEDSLFVGNLMFPEQQSVDSDGKHQTRNTQAFQAESSFMKNMRDSVQISVGTRHHEGMDSVLSLVDQSSKGAGTRGKKQLLQVANVLLK